MNLSLLLAILQYVAAHVAAFGGLITALVLALQGHWTEALQALLTALAGFGIMKNPVNQAKLTEVAKETRRAA